MPSDREPKLEEARPLVFEAIIEGLAFLKKNGVDWGYVLVKNQPGFYPYLAYHDECGYVSFVNVRYARHSDRHGIGMNHNWFELSEDGKHRVKSASKAQIMRCFLLTYNDLCEAQGWPPREES